MVPLFYQTSNLNLYSYLGAKIFQDVEIRGKKKFRKLDNFWSLAVVNLPPSLLPTTKKSLFWSTITHKYTYIFLYFDKGKPYIKQNYNFGPKFNFFLLKSLQPNILVYIYITNQAYDMDVFANEIPVPILLSSWVFQRTLYSSPIIR